MPGPPVNRRLLAVSPVGQPGGAEVGLLRLLTRLGPRGWDITLATPPEGTLPDAARANGWRWEALRSGPLAGGRRRAAVAVASWPRARALARAHDVVYLNGTVSGRLLPAMSET